MLSFFPRGVLDEILNLIESVSEGFPSCSFILFVLKRSYVYRILLERVSFTISGSIFLFIMRFCHLKYFKILTILVVGLKMLQNVLFSFIFFIFYYISLLILF